MTVIILFISGPSCPKLKLSVFKFGTLKNLGGAYINMDTNGMNEWKGFPFTVGLLTVPG